MRSRLTLLAMLVCAFSCDRPKREVIPADRYQLEGEVIRVDAAHRLALVRHGDIHNAEGKVWMRGMTMEFPVREKVDLEKLAPGVRFKATLFHVPQDIEYWLAEIAVLPAP